MFDFSTRISGEPVRMVLPEMGPRTDARTIARRLWRGSPFIVLGGLIMVAAAVVVLGLIPPSYTSNIQILVDPTDLRVVENDVNAANLYDHARKKVVNGRLVVQVNFAGPKDPNAGSPMMGPNMMNNPHGGLKP